MNNFIAVLFLTISFIGKANEQNPVYNALSSSIEGRYFFDEELVQDTLARHEESYFQNEALVIANPSKKIKKIHHKLSRDFAKFDLIALKYEGDKVSPRDDRKIRRVKKITLFKIERLKSLIKHIKAMSSICATMSASSSEIYDKCTDEKLYDHVSGIYFNLAESGQLVGPVGDFLDIMDAVKETPRPESGSKSCVSGPSIDTKQIETLEEEVEEAFDF